MFGTQDYVENGRRNTFFFKEGIHILYFISNQD